MKLLSCSKRPEDLASFLLLPLIALVHLPALSQEGGDSQDEALQALRREIGQVSKELDQQVRARDQERVALEQVEKEIVQIDRQLAQTREERSAQIASIARIDETIADEKGQQTMQREELETLVYTTYFMGEKSYLKMLLNQQNPYSLGRTINYYRYISAARRNELAEIRKELDKLVSLRAEKESQQASLEETENRFRIQADKLKDARAERDRFIASLQQQISSTGTRLSALREDQERLAKLAGSLAKYSTRRQQTSSLPGGFDKQRGRLQLPVAGKLQQEYGTTVPGSGLSSNGIFINTEDAAGVHTVFDGRVIFADWLRGFGLLVIVDHGDGFMSLYGHNKSLYKQLGDYVETGELIAESGTTGGLTSPGVYFEIRREGKPQNPMLWCGL